MLVVLANKEACDAELLSPSPHPDPRDLRKQLSDARLSAVVEAAYILREASR
jgi:hypothetical protein